MPLKGKATFGHSAISPPNQKLPIPKGGQTMNALDIVLIAAIAVAVGLAVWRLARNRRQGKSACGCDCGSCSCGCGKKRGRL